MNLHLLHTQESEWIDIRCTFTTTPRLYAVVGETTLVEGTFSDLGPGEGGHFIRQLPTGYGWWAIPSDCSVKRAVNELGAPFFEFQEYPRVSAAMLRERVSGAFEERERGWLEAADSEHEWVLRYQTLRPPTGFAQGPIVVPPKGAVHSFLERTPTVRQHWWRANPPTWEIEGPSRVLVTARTTDTGASACLSVDTKSYCQQVREEHNYNQGPDKVPQRVPKKFGAEIVNAATTWRVRLGPGKHHLALDQPAFARIVYFNLESDPEGLIPPAAAAESKVFPPSCDEKEQGPWCPERSIRVNPVVRTSEQVELLIEQATTDDEEAIRWLPISPKATLPANVAWVGQDHAATFWFRMTEGTPCSIAFSEQHKFLGIPHHGRNRFLWTGDALPPSSLPKIDGCAGWVRSVGPVTAGAGTFTIQRMQVVNQGEELTFTSAPEAVPASIWVSWPLPQTEPFSVVITSHGRDETYIVRPTTRTATSSSLRDLLQWATPVRIPFALSADTRVRTSARVALRVTAQQRDLGLKATPTQPPHDTTPTATAGLRELSVAFAAARDSATGASILRRRSELLFGLGLEDAGLSDAAVAAAMFPILDSTPRRPATVAARELFGKGEWVPEESLWIPSHIEENTRTALLSAGERGDYVQIANEAKMSTPARLWAWRRCVLEGQTLTIDEHLRPYLLLAQAGPGALEPASLWPLRTTTRWNPVGHIGGGQSTTVEAAHSPGDEEAIEDLLYPDAWPLPETLPMKDGKKLTVPAQKQPLSLAVRCRATSGAHAGTPCTFVLQDARGAQRSAQIVQSTGSAAEFILPESDTPLFLTVFPQAGVSAQIRVPQALRGEWLGPVKQRAWRFTPDRTASIEVLGPTVLRLRCEGPCATGTVRIGEGESMPLRREFIVPVETAGRVEIRIKSSAPWTGRADIRVPKPSGHAPWGDRLALSRETYDASFRPGATPTGDVLDRPTPFVQPRPEQAPPVTARLGAEAGSQTDVDDPEHATTFAATSWIGAATRPWVTPLYFAAVAGQTTPVDQASFAEGRLAAEWKPLSEATELDVSIQLRRTHTLMGTDAFSTDHAAIQLHLTRWVAPRLALFGQTRLSTRRVTEGAFDPNATLHSQLWSAYQNDHPRAATMGIGGRYWVRRMARVNVITTGTTNSRTEDQAIDHAKLDASIDYGLPNTWIRSGAHAEYRFSDAHRPTAYWNPEMYVQLDRFYWLPKLPGLELTATLSYQPHFGRLSYSVGLAGEFSVDRGLRDRRPSTHPFKRSATWQHGRIEASQ